MRRRHVDYYEVYDDYAEGSENKVADENGITCTPMRQCVRCSAQEQGKGGDFNQQCITKEERFQFESKSQQLLQQSSTSSVFTPLHVLALTPFLAASLHRAEMTSSFAWTVHFRLEAQQHPRRSVPFGHTFSERFFVDSQSYMWRLQPVTYERACPKSDFKLSLRRNNNRLPRTTAAVSRCSLLL